MIIKSDWHIHSESSYDSKLPLSQIIEKSQEYGFERIGITDHVNNNTGAFISDLDSSVADVAQHSKECKRLVLGVELTPIEKPFYDYIAQHGSAEGYVAPISDKPYEIMLPMTREDLIAKGVRYAIGASHWRIDCAGSKDMPAELEPSISEWYRQQLWMACDERVTVLGHPWYHGKGIWYEDFSVIPRSMNMEIAAALKENGKYVECNGGVICSVKTSEKFRRQYVEFLREMFEMGIPVTYGSDAHNSYPAVHLQLEKYLAEAGFAEGDIVGISECDLW